MLARVLYIIFIFIPTSLPAVAGRICFEPLVTFAGLLPWWDWIGLASLVAIAGLLLIIAKRAKVTEDEVGSDVLDASKEMNLHQFFEYVGVRIGNVSVEGLQHAEAALKKLQSLARADSVKAWGDICRPAFHGIAEVIPCDHWKFAFIYPADALAAHPPRGIKTHLRDARLRNLPLDRQDICPELYDHLYFSASAVRRQFGKGEFQSEHVPSFRAAGDAD